MEHTDQTENPQLTVTEEVRSYIYETTKWTRLLAIVGFVVSAFTALTALGAQGIISAMSQVMGEANNPYAKIGAGPMMFFLLLAAFIYFYPSLLLFNYSNKARNAVFYAEQDEFTAAMAKMKSFFKFWGVLTIVVLGLYALIIIASITMGVGASLTS